MLQRWLVVIIGLPLLLARRYAAGRAEMRTENDRLALGLLALTVRALLGRRRLKQAAARYQDPDCRMGCGYILCAVHDLLGQPGLPEDPLSPENAEDLVYLEREVWYSGHTMTEDQRRRCLALLESARRVWREQTPALRRFAARFQLVKKAF